MEIRKITNLIYLFYVLVFYFDFYSLRHFLDYFLVTVKLASG